MTNYETITLDVRDGIAVVTMNRPERLNALSFRMMAELSDALLVRVRSDATARAVVLTGAGSKAFCAGADIKERAAARPTAVETFEDLQGTIDLFNGIENLDKPVIAAINGYAMGGGLELALCCDIRVAARHARLGLPELKLGALPAAGGTQRLPRLIGASKAKELLFTGDPVTAEEALRLGLVNQVSDESGSLAMALAIATKAVQLAPLSLMYAKRAVNRGLQVGIEAGLEYERYAASLLMDTQDRREGMQAFVEKRPARFQGR